MEGNDRSVRFLFGTVPGRAILKIIKKTHMDRIAVKYLRSPLSKPYMKRFAAKNGLAADLSGLKSYRTYRDFFLRDKPGLDIDMDPVHLISPCDSWLSAFRIEGDSAFKVKGSYYSLSDLMGEGDLSKRFAGGDCLIFRLCPDDYHHYCYIDNGFKNKNHFIEGELNSVQPIAQENFRVYTLNRRSWCLMETENFGPVVQTEVGAIIVGGIVNLIDEGPVKRGEEKGYFDLMGSTIVLFFEKDRIRLKEDIIEKLKKEPEVRVSIGKHIGYRV